MADRFGLNRGSRSCFPFVSTEWLLKPRKLKNHVKILMSDWSGQENPRITVTFHKITTSLKFDFLGLNFWDWRPKQSLKVRYVIFIFYCICACCFFKNLFQKIQFSKNQGANCRHSRFEARNESPMMRKYELWMQENSKLLQSEFKRSKTLGPSPECPNLGPKHLTLGQTSQKPKFRPIKAQALQTWGVEAHALLVRRTPHQRGAHLFAGHLQTAFNAVWT